MCIKGVLATPPPSSKQTTPTENKRSVPACFGKKACKGVGEDLDRCRQPNEQAGKLSDLRRPIYGSLSGLLIQHANELAKALIPLV